MEEGEYDRISYIQRLPSKVDGETETELTEIVIDNPRDYHKADIWSVEASDGHVTRLLNERQAKSLTHILNWEESDIKIIEHSFTGNDLIYTVQTPTEVVKVSASKADPRQVDKYWKARNAKREMPMYPMEVSQVDSLVNGTNAFQVEISVPETDGLYCIANSKDLIDVDTHQKLCEFYERHMLR